MGQTNGTKSAKGSLGKDRYRDKQMILAMVLARLQAQGKKLEDINEQEKQTLINDAIADLMLAESCVERN